MVLRINFNGPSHAFHAGIPKTQSANTAEGLRADGEAVRDLIPGIVTALIETANDDLAQLGYFDFITMPSFRMAMPKTLHRMNEKARDEYEGSYIDIRDVERGSIDLRKPEHIAAFCSVLDWARGHQVLLPHGAVICIAENRFISPTDSGYSSHKANIVIPIPGQPGRHHIVELMTKNEEFEQIIEAQKSHQKYDTKRKLDGRLATGRFDVSLSKMYAQVYRDLQKIHEDARRHCHFDEIDFKPFAEHRAQASEDELEVEIKKEV